MPLFIARILLLGSDPAEGDGEYRRRMRRALSPLNDRIYAELAQARAQLDFTYRNNLDLR